MQILKNGESWDEYAFYFLVFVGVAWIFEGIVNVNNLTFTQGVIMLMPIAFVLGIVLRKMLKIR